MRETFHERDCHERDSPYQGGNEADDKVAFVVVVVVANDETAPTKDLEVIQQMTLFSCRYDANDKTVLTKDFEVIRLVRFVVVIVAPGSAFILVLFSLYRSICRAQT